MGDGVRCYRKGLLGAVLPGIGYFTQIWEFRLLMGGIGNFSSYILGILAIKSKLIIYNLQSLKYLFVLFFFNEFKASSCQKDEC